MKNLYTLNFAENRLVFKQPPERVNRGPEKNELPPNIIRECDKKLNTRFDQLGKMTKPQTDKVISLDLMPKLVDKKIRSLKGYEDYIKVPMFQKSFAEKREKIINALKNKTFNYNVKEVKEDSKGKLFYKIYEKAGIKNPMESSDEGASISDQRQVKEMRKNIASKLNGKVKPAERIKQIADNSITIAKNSVEEACSSAVYTDLENAVNSTFNRIWTSNG